MLIEHRGKRPRIDPSAWVAPSAVISGAVHIGPESRVLHGAIISAEGASVAIGSRCVVMEQAVVRASGSRKRSFPTTIGDDSLIGPHAYLTGCTIDERCFVATGAIIFNGAHLQRGCEVTLQGIVHVGTTLEPGTVVPLQHIAVGTPARIFAPAETESMQQALYAQNFWRLVFDIEREDRPLEDIIAECLAKYSRGLGAHRDDRVLGDGA